MDARGSAATTLGGFFLHHRLRRLLLLALRRLGTAARPLGKGSLLLLDRRNLAHAVGGIDDELVDLEALTLGRLLGGHSRGRSFVRLAAQGSLCHGGCAACRRARYLPALAGRGLFAPPGDGGGLL